MPSSLAGSPCSTKLSGRPRFSTGMLTPAACRASSTALPAPPGRQPSSTVTSASWLRASWSSNSVSSGLTKRMLATVASSRSPAASAGYSSVPKARIAMRRERPSRRSSPQPQGSAFSSGSMAAPTPAPRG